ncbi:uncharacterized protein LOC141783617 [Sebastes fasciatus]|uniref:uncharacterized protein LOC141783617 n=1 Tax=Sebastes fasciatus TaxID=394691 RepID=UPI003D9ECB13
MPKLGMSMPKVKGPEFHFGLTKKDGDVTLPEAIAEVELPEAPKISVDMKSPEFEGEIDGQGGKFKMPKLGMSMPKVKGPEFHFGLSKKDGDVTLPEAKAEVKVPEVELKGPSAEVEIKAPEVKVRAKGKEESPLKFKMPSFKLPKFGVVTPNVSVEVPDMDKDVKFDGADIKIPDEGAAVHIAAPSIDIEGPSIDVKTTGAEQDGKGGKFKMPHLGFAMPKVKGPKMDVSLSKKDVDVKLPETKADFKLPEVDLGKVNVSIPEAKLEVTKPEMEMQTEGELDGQGEKFKMPKFGIKMPEIDFSSSKKDTDITLPGTKAEIKLPEGPKIDASLGKAEVLIPEAKLEIRKPEVEIKPLQTDIELEGHKGKFQMPKFGVSMPKVKGPEFDLSWSKKDVDVTLPEAKAEVELPDTPNIAVDMKPPEFEGEMDGQGGKFKMPKFGISMPKVKGPEFDLSWSKKDVDVTLPEAKAEVELPDTPNIAVDMKPPEFEGEMDGQGGKFKMPKFGISMPKVKGPEFDLSWSKKDVDVTLPEAKAEVNLPDVELKEPSAKVEVKAPEIEAHLGSVKGSPSKFKLPTFKFPKFGAATPTVSAEVPDIDKEIKIDGGDMHISVPHTDVDVPEVKAEVHLPDVHVKKPSGGIVIEQQPGVEVDAKVKRPRFSLPRFSFSKPSVKSPEVDASLQDVNVTIPEGKVEVKGGEVDVKLPECEAEVEGSKFKLPKFGITMPKVKGPDIDLSWSKKDVDVTLPEAKAEVELPDTPKIAVDMKPPECEGEIDGQGGKFKMPKFGITMPKVKGPDFDLSWSKKDVDVTLPEAKAEVELPDAPKIAVDMKPPECEGEIDGQGGKFKMPKFGITMPKVKGPEFDLSWSKKDVDVTLPEAKAEVELPDAPKIAVEMKPPECEADIDGQGGKFKMPKFGVSMPKVKGPEFDLSWSKKDVDVTLPEAKAEVELPDAPTIAVEMKPPEFEGEIDGQGGKFKMPKFGITMPKVKGPEFDLSWSKKDVDVTLPEAKAEVELPDAPKIAVDMKPPECEGEIDGQGGKFKMPKFGITMPKVKGPEFDLSWSKKDVDVTLPEAKAEVELPDAPKIAVDMKPPECEADIDGQGGKFKMPKFGILMPKVKGPEFDLSWSKKDVDVTLPEAKAEVNLPDVELKEPSAKVEVKAPEIEAHLGSVKGSPSKFKLPTFKFPKFGAATPTVSAEVPDIDKEIKIDGGDMHISVPHTDVDVPEVKAEVHLPDVHVKKPSGSIVIEQQPGVEVDAKVKRPRFSLPRFSFSKPSVKSPEVDASLQDVNVTIPEGKLEVKGGEVDVKLPECEAEVEGSKFKLPKFGITMPKVTGPEIDLSVSKKDVTLPEAQAEIQLPNVELKEPKVEIKAPEIKVATKDTEGSPSKFKMPTFKLPKFGIATVEVPDMDKDIKIDGADINMPEEVLTVEMAAPSVDIEGPSIDIKTTGTEHERKGSKFKLPSLGFSGPQVKQPDIDLSVSKNDGDVTLPEAKVDVKLPDVGLKEPSAEVDIKAPKIKVAAKDKDGSPSKFKMPTFKLPKFGIATVEVPDMDKDIKIDGADINMPEEVLTVEMAAPSVDIEGPSIDIKTTGTEHERKGSMFKLPSLGFSGPQVKQPDIDLSVSKKDGDVTLPEAKVDVKLPDVGLKEPSAEVDIKAPKIKVAAKDKDGSPSKFKMPTFKLPKFGIATVEVPDMDKDIKIDGADINIPEEVLTVEMAAPSVDIEGPSIDIKTTGTEHERKGSMFKLPSLGFSGPQVKQPDIDLSVSKKDGDVTLPEAKVDVKLPDVGLKEPSAEVDIKAPKIKVATKDKDGSPSKFKMPTFKLPKFGIITPSATVEMPDMDKDVKIDGADIKIPEEVLTVEIAAPSADIEGPSIDIKTTGTEHEGSKFKLPSFGFSGPQIKRPDIDFSLSKKDVDVTLPAVKAEVKLPDVEVKELSAKVEIKAPGIDVKTSNVEGSPSKLKMPTFKLPKFGASVEVPDVDEDIKVDGADLKLPEAKVEVKLPDVDIKESMIEGDAKLRKTSWTMPKFSFSKTSVKAPEADVNLDVPKVDVTLPEAKADVNLPDIDIKESSGISIEGAPATDLDAKLKKTRFSLPRFSFSKQGSKESKVDVSLPDVDVSLPEGNMEVKQPEVEFKPPEVDVELEGQESKFKLPKFGISMPKVKGPEIDLSLSKKDVDVTLPEAKAEVHLPDVKIKPPSATVEIKAPQIEVQTGNVEGSPSKYKMPTFTLPKFGAATPKVSVEVPDVDKDIKIDGAKVNVTAPSIDTEGLSVDVKAKGSELEGSGSKFKLPKFGISMPKVKGPEIDLSVSKKDVTLPEAQAEIQLPNIEVKEPKVEIKAPEIKVATKDTEGSPSKYKMPTFTLPKFGAATPKVSVEVPDVDKDIKIDGAKVNVTAPSIDTEGLSVDVKAKGSELEGSGSKFKLPKFGISMPKVKGPEIDLSVSKKDVTLPEAQAEIQLPNIEVKEPKVEIKAPEIKVATKDKEGSPSKYKMPTFKLPKFGMGTPSATVEVPDMDKDIKIDGADIQFPEEVLAVHMAAPSVDIEGPSIDIKTTGTEHEEKGSKFKLPSLSFSGPQVKQPDIDLSLSKKDVDVTLPEAEVKLPDVEVKETEGAISVPDAPTVEVDTKMKRPGWTFPKFSFSRTGGKAPDVDVNIEAPKVDVTSPEVIVEVQGPSGAISMEEPPAAELDENLKKSKFSLPRFSFSKSSVKEPEELPRVDVSLPEGEVIVTQPEVKIKAPELEAEHDGQGSKFKLPKFGIALPKAKGPEEDLSASQKDAGITLPEVKAKVKLPEIEVKGSSASVEIKASETEGSQSKFKMPTLKMPKFGAATYDVTVEAPDAEKVSETDGAKLKEDVTVSIKGPSIDIKTDVSKAADAKTPKTETDGAGLISPSKFKLPSFGNILKSIDIEFDVPKTEQNLETSKEVHETNEPSGKQVEEKETKQDTIKSPERTGWFRFPKFGMSSTSEPAKSAEKDESKDEKSPVWETAEEELSPTCSIQSSDAFADISSAMTSEHVGLSSSSPTKVTVKYSDPNVATGLGEMHGNIVTSTTRTELISVEPNLPEKITILSSSSEDTLRLESGKIHVITSNIQATPEAEHARLLSAVHIQSAGGLPLESGANEAASWTVEDSQGGKKTVFERHSVRQTSSERSESKETIVITKQITRRFDSSEPISGETASSIQRLKDSVHSEKMRFFDGVDE